MVSTRLASPCNGLGISALNRRDRVDPAKLIGLIHRIKTASGAVQTAQAVNSKPAAKAG